MWSWLKKISWEWLPLTGMVTMVYMIQRGFLAIHKAGIAPEGLDIKSGMAVFFTAAAFACLGFGFLSDRVKTSIMIAVAAICGGIGILALPFTPLVFGIGMGIAAAIVKMVPFSAPLKAKDTKHEAMRITPQALGKQLGAALMMFVLGATIKTAGFSTFLAVLLPVWLGISYVAYELVKKHNLKLLKWDAESVKANLLNWKFYVYSAWYAGMALALYTVLPMIIPTFIGMDMTKAEAVTLYGTVGLIVMWLRFAWSWLADRFSIHVHLMFTAIAIYVASIFLMPIVPIVAIAGSLAIMQAVTPSMWTTAKNWFTKEYMGTAMGMVMIVSYLAVGLYLGKW